ncbi:MAG TPA: hypothetical protein PKY96_06850, partial [Flavobacteriales bacterium]|nr:hypothetical protein [Flavobacteriales bacterium]
MKRALLGLVAGSWLVSGLAQCGPCAVGDTCTVNPPFPAVCPAVTPIGTVGVPYDLDVTFWLPPSFPEPTTQLNVILQQVTLISMENVPIGLTYEASSPTLTYFPQTDPFGCVRVCGTPLVAGNDTILITAFAQGTAGGIALNQNYSFGIPIQVLPAAQDSLPDFSFAPDSLCAPMMISFSEALGAPGVTTSFEWTFGNGSSFDGASPPDQSYSEGGAYPVTLQRTFSVPMITQIAITGVSNAWCGDLDEPNLPLVGCVGQPDLYFTLTDSRLALWRSAVVNNVQSTAWNNLSIPLGFPPFTLRIYDKDDLSADDLLGTFTLSAAEGSASFSQGGTAGSRQVQVQTVLTSSYTDTVVVHPVPSIALELDLSANSICASDQTLAEYAWALNGVSVPDETGPCVPAANGLWSVVGVTAFGCSGAASLTVTSVGVEEGSSSGALHLWPNPADQW